MSKQARSSGSLIQCRADEASVVAERKDPDPRPPGFESPHPGGMVDNSPTFQRWVREYRVLKVPKGRLKLRDSSAVPSGLHSILSLFPKVETRLKPWAIIASPFGRKTWRRS